MEHETTVNIMRKMMCSLGYHYYHPSGTEVKYLRNEGRSWVYQFHAECVYCGKQQGGIFSVEKPIKEKRDA